MASGWKDLPPAIVERPLSCQPRSTKSVAFFPFSFSSSFLFSFCLFLRRKVQKVYPSFWNCCTLCQLGHIQVWATGGPSEPQCSNKLSPSIWSQSFIVSDGFSLSPVSPSHLSIPSLCKHCELFILLFNFWSTILCANSILIQLQISRWRAIDQMLWFQVSPGSSGAIISAPKIEQTLVSKKKLRLKQKNHIIWDLSLSLENSGISQPGLTYKQDLKNV